MKLSAPVSTIMTDKVFSVDVNESLFKVQELFETKHIRHMPVVKDGLMVGIVSLTDLRRLSFADQINDDSENMTIFEMLSLDQIMMRNVHTVSPSQTIREVAEKLSTEEYHAFPVVETGELKGIVSTTDIIKFLLNNAD